MTDCVFCKIVSGEVPAQIVDKDDSVVVFKDIKPLKPTHLLVIPKEHIGDYTQAGDKAILAIKRKIADLVSQMDLAAKGYRIEVNGGAAMGVPHLHFHLLAPVGVAEKL